MAAGLSTCRRVVIVADTHDIQIPFETFPEGDLLVHCGDLTSNGTQEQLRKAAFSLRKASERYRFGCVVVMGNHDKPMDAESWVRWAHKTRSMDEPPEPLPDEKAGDYDADGGGDRGKKKDHGSWTRERLKEAQSWFSSGGVVTLQDTEYLVGVMCKAYGDILQGRQWKLVESSKPSLGSGAGDDQRQTERQAGEQQRQRH